MAIRYDHARIQEFLLGRGGGVRSIRHKKALTMFFLCFFFYFLVLNLFYRIPVVTYMYFQKKLSFSKVPVGVDHFPGVQLFPDGGGGGPIACSL